MQLSQFTDYSLRILIYLGIHSSRLSSIAEIARCYHISQNHLMKIVHHLGKAGFIQTIRGRNGGIQLNRHPHEITLSSIIKSTEESNFPIKCNACLIRENCLIQEIIYKAFDAFYHVLGQYTLADAIANRTELEHLLLLTHSNVCHEKL